MVFRDDLLRRPRNEVRIGEFCVDLNDVRTLPGDFLLKSRPFGGDVDKAAKRHRDDGSVDKELDGAGRRDGRELDCLDPRHTLDRVAPTRRDFPRARISLDQRQLHLRPGGNAHFRADRTHLRNERDHPADFRLGIGISGIIGPWPWTQRKNMRARRTRADVDRPKFFSEERHERVQQAGNLVEHIGDRRLGLSLPRALDAALQHRLGEFEMPVAKHIPHKAVGGVGGVVEAECFDGAGGLVDRPGSLAQNPAVERLAHLFRIEPGDTHAAIDLGKARGVPELGRKIAIALDAVGRHLDVAALRRHRRQREAQGVSAIFVDEVERVDHIAFRLRHFRAALVAHQRVNVDVAERDFVSEVQAHHHHPGDPEEDDVKAGDEHLRGIKALELRRLVRPAKCRERP